MNTIRAVNDVARQKRKKFGAMMTGRYLAWSNICHVVPPTRHCGQQIMRTLFGVNTAFVQMARFSDRHPSFPFLRFRLFAAGFLVFNVYSITRRIPRDSRKKCITRGVAFVSIRVVSHRFVAETVCGCWLRERNANAKDTSELSSVIRTRVPRRIPFCPIRNRISYRSRPVKRERRFVAAESQLAYANNP